MRTSKKIYSRRSRKMRRSRRMKGGATLPHPDRPHLPVKILGRMGGSRKRRGGGFSFKVTGGRSRKMRGGANGHPIIPSSTHPRLQYYKSLGGSRKMRGGWIPGVIATGIADTHPKGYIKHELQNKITGGGRRNRRGGWDGPPPPRTNATFKGGYHPIPIHQLPNQGAHLNQAVNKLYDKYDGAHINRGGRGRKTRKSYKGGMPYGGPLSPHLYDGQGVGTSGVGLQFVAGNSG